MPVGGALSLQPAVRRVCPVAASPGVETPVYAYGRPSCYSKTCVGGGLAKPAIIEHLEVSGSPIYAWLRPASWRATSPLKTTPPLGL